ncbi:MAG: acyl carrier protein [Xanthobacteraceae bacterium]|jgi:acyl carrier protein
MRSKNYLSGAELVASAIGGEPGSFQADSELGRHPKWDSFSHLNVMLLLEQEFGIVIDDATIDKYSRLSAIDELVKVKG